MFTILQSPFSLHHLSECKRLIYVESKDKTIIFNRFQVEGPSRRREKGEEAGSYRGPCPFVDDHNIYFTLTLNVIRVATQPKVTFRTNKIRTLHGVSHELLPITRP